MFCSASVIPGLVFSENFLQFNLGIVGAVAGNLIVLRFLGLKLFSVVQQIAPASLEWENPVKPPHFQSSQRGKRRERRGCKKSLATL